MFFFSHLLSSLRSLFSSMFALCQAHLAMTGGMRPNYFDLCAARAYLRSVYSVKEICSSRVMAEMLMTGEVTIIKLKMLFGQKKEGFGV